MHVYYLLLMCKICPICILFCIISQLTVSGNGVNILHVAPHAVLEQGLDTQSSLGQQSILEDHVLHLL